MNGYCNNGDMGFETIELKYLNVITKKHTKNQKWLTYCCCWFCCCFINFAWSNNGYYHMLFEVLCLCCIFLYFNSSIITISQHTFSVNTIKKKREMYSVVEKCIHYFNVIRIFKLYLFSTWWQLYSSFLILYD